MRKKNHVIKLKANVSFKKNFIKKMLTTNNPIKLLIVLYELLFLCKTRHLPEIFDLVHKNHVRYTVPTLNYQKPNQCHELNIMVFEMIQRNRSKNFGEINFILPFLTNLWFAKLI